MTSWLALQHSMAISPHSVATEQHRLAAPCLDHKETMAKSSNWCIGATRPALARIHDFATTLMAKSLLGGEAGNTGCLDSDLRWAGPLQLKPFSLPSQWLWGLNSQYLLSFMRFPGDKDSTEEANFPNLDSQSLKSKRKQGS